MRRPRHHALPRTAAQLAQLPTLGHETTLLQSYPKSGSTWFKFVVGAVVQGRPQHFDQTGALFADLPGNSFLPPDRTPLYRTHDPRRIPRALIRCRTVLLARDPTDVLPSYWEYRQASGTSYLSFDQFLARALAGSLDDGYDSWDRNVQSWLDLPRTLVVRYEDLVERPAAEYGRVLAFMEVEVSPTTLTWALEQSSRMAMHLQEAGARTLSGYGGRFVSAHQRLGRRSLTTGDLRSLTKAFGSTMQRLGYATDAS